MKAVILAGQSIWAPISFGICTIHTPDPDERWWQGLCDGVFATNCDDEADVAVLTEDGTLRHTFGDMTAETIISVTTEIGEAVIDRLPLAQAMAALLDMGAFGGFEVMFGTPGASGAN